MPNTRAEPLTEGIRALRCRNRSDAAALRGSWNCLTPFRRTEALLEPGEGEFEA
jgi:hypothetical protein